jgi:hypothetical protein
LGNIAVNFLLAFTANKTAYTRTYEHIWCCCCQSDHHVDPVAW